MHFPHACGTTLADLDLIIANYGGANQLYLNDGSGAFTKDAASPIAVGSVETQSIALGDVDGDGGARSVVGR